VRVSADLEANVHVLGNATDLQRVFNNILENARRYGKTPGGELTEIDISCHVVPGKHGKRVVIALQDHGTGVPDAEIGQLLKPFTRMDTARGQANGAGLGLAIVERVMSKHHAELHVGNRAGGGLLVRISMALAG
jgi:two-component system osmolarity sensor histidine kinase EnvZ